MAKQENNQKKDKQKFKIKSWYSNRYQIVSVQRNILLIFAAFCVISMSVAVVLVKYIVSSKSLEPYVIEIEEKSGVATVVDQMTVKNFTGDELMKKYFINEFIQSSTGYDPRTYKQDAEKIRLLSSAAVYNNFRARINPKDLGADSRIEVRIKSIQFPSITTAQIRILTNSNIRGEEVSSKNEVVTLNFSFNTDMNLTMEERLINPLGFQVTNYIIAEEIFNY
jgi:type IV secretion system protein VirB8